MNQLHVGLRWFWLNRLRCGVILISIICLLILLCTYRVISASTSNNSFSGSKIVFKCVHGELYRFEYNSLYSTGTACEEGGLK